MIRLGPPGPLVLLGLLVWLPGSLSAQREAREPLVVRGLDFDGNRAIDDFTLSVSIATSQSAFFARFPLLRWLGLGEKRYFDETDFRRDVLRITALYRRSGFREVQVDTLVERIGGDVHLRFLIDEGRPVRVTSSRITGVDGIVAPGYLARQLPLRVHDPFDLFVLQASQDTIRSFIRDRGYPFTEVYPNFDASQRDYSADVFYHVEPGPRARVGAIDVVGARKLDEGVVRRLLAIDVGDWFSESALRESQLDLYRTGMFNVVSVQLADSLVARDTSVTVQVRVAEGPFRRIRLGAGYGTVDCFRSLTSYTISDFLGGGRTLDFSTRLSKIGTGSPFNADLEHSLCPELRDENVERLKFNYSVTASLREPIFFSGDLSATISATAERHSEFQAFFRESYGGDFAVTWDSPLHVPFTMSYGLSTTRTDAEPAIFCSFLNVCRLEDTRVFRERFRRRSVVSLSGVWDRSNSLLDPSRGTRLTGELRFASRAIGSDSLIQFIRGVAEFAAYHRVARRGVFAWRLRLGAIRSPRLGDPEGEEDRFIPPEDRFYGGGPNSVRGYGQNELGPLVRVRTVANPDAAVPDTVVRPSATGGVALVFGNAELRFPLPGFSGRVVGAAFVDAGQVFARGETIEPARLRVTPGLGVRFVTGIGPVRFDVAYNPYDVQTGRLYEERQNGELGCRRGSAESCELVLTSVRFPEQPPDRGLFDRLQLQFSVGQAF